MTFAEQAASILRAVEVEADNLPVLVMVRGNVVLLGRARNHQAAEVIGLLHGVSCTKVSRATLQDNAREFFVLH